MMSWREQLDTVFLVEQGKIPGMGEDSFCAMEGQDRALAAVFDGSGGSGAMTYPKFRHHTGAYIAARLVSGAVRDWFCALGWRSSPADMEFEALLLESVCEGVTPERCRARLHSVLSALAQDDFTLAGMVFGFGDYPALRRAMAERRRELRQYLPSRRESVAAEQDSLARLWQEYRRRYERYLRRSES